MILFHVSLNHLYFGFYSLIKYNFTCYIDSYVFFHSDLSGHWLWNLEGIYSFVLETDQEVPYKTGAQDLECRVLFVSDFMKLVMTLFIIMLLACFKCFYILGIFTGGILAFYQGSSILSGRFRSQFTS
jgi:hypothetical protein